MKNSKFRVLWDNYRITYSNGVLRLFNLESIEEICSFSGEDLYNLKKAVDKAIKLSTAKQK